MENHNLEKPLLVITRKQALGIIDCLEIMRSCFDCVVSEDNGDLIKLFYKAKASVHNILSEGCSGKVTSDAGKEGK